MIICPDFMLSIVIACRLYQLRGTYHTAVRHSSHLEIPTMTTRTRKQPTDEQKARAAERREKFRALAKHVAEMPDSARTALVDRCGAVVTCEGRALSFVNTCLVLTQRPGASMVGGFAQWLK